MKPTTKLHQEILEQRRSLLGRLYLDGFQEIYKSVTRFEKIMWIVSMILLYGCALAFTIVTIGRYRTSGLIIDVQEQPPKSTYQFPAVMVCHVGNFNKTYVEENIHIPDHILRNASTKFNMTEKEVLEEFVRYMRMFNSASTNNAGTFDDEKKWALLTEIFEHNFRDVDFSNFLADAAFRGREIFRNCEFDQKPFPCKHVPLVMYTPSCYEMLVERHSNMFHFEAEVSKTAKTKGLKFEIFLEKKHIFEENDINEMGVNLFLTYLPSPFSEMLAFPGNTHAVVEVQSTEIRLQSDCYVKAPNVTEELSADEPGHNHAPVSTPVYSRDMCLIDAIQNTTRQTCNCFQTGGTYYPSNNQVCTPNHMKNCVLENMGSLDQAERFERLMKTYCKPMCNDYAYSATISYYDIDPINDSVIRNKFDIFYYSKRRFVQVERPLTNPYEILCNVGGIIGVYTGLSAAAAAQMILVLAIAAGRRCVRDVFKSFVSKKVPLATTYENTSPKKANIIPLKRSVRVEPTKVAKPKIIIPLKRFVRVEPCNVTTI